MNVHLKKYVNDWLRKADHDISSVQRLLEIEPMILESACFHCQQAIEKYLKAFLFYHSENIEKTHDISFLLKECTKRDIIFSSINPLNISDYAVNVRYPGIDLEPDEQEAKGFYALALRVRDMVKERMVFD